MANTNMSTQSSPQQNRNIYDGSVAIFWDMETCPIPSNICTEEAASNILKALRAHQINGVVPLISAYGYFTRFSHALDNCPPDCIMLISGDDKFSHALHRLFRRGYTVILAIPSGVCVSSPLRKAGS
ncbi:endonuclease [Tanacetum coccineum]